MSAAYLGDGVYAETGPDGMIWLYTSDGRQRTNSIGFEPEVLVMLVKYLEKNAPIDLRKVLG